jgi:hypothetical protein
MRLMRTLSGLAAVAAVAMTTTACVPRTPVLPYYGLLFNNTGMPVDIAFGPNEIGTASGRASATTVLGLLSWGDCSIEGAAKDGNLATVDHVDAHVTNILFGVYTKYETIAYGQAEP